MNEPTRYVLIDDKYNLPFTGYYHSLPSQNAAAEYIEISMLYTDETYQTVKTLPAVVNKIELYSYNEEQEKAICINKEENSWIKQQVATNYRDYGNFTITVTYQVAQ